MLVYQRVPEGKCSYSLPSDIPMFGVLTMWCSPPNVVYPLLTRKIPSDIGLLHLCRLVLLSRVDHGLQGRARCARRARRCPRGEDVGYVAAMSQEKHVQLWPELYQL